MKKITFCLLLFLAFFQSQGQVLVGNGTTLKNLPINPYYGYSYSQTIYQSSEINASGDITGLSWYYGGPVGNNIPNSQTLKVYLGHTSKNHFASDSDWEETSNFTEVYSGDIPVDGPGWVSINFSTPFDYNGTDNLIVATAELHPGYDNNNDFFVSYEVSGDRSLIYQNDTTLPNLTEPQSGSRLNFVPNIIFGGIAKACQTPFLLNTAMVSSSSAVIIWSNTVQGPDNSSQYYISESNVAPLPETFPNGNSTSFAMLSDLQADTLYHFWVRNICDGTVGEWSYPVSFRTECDPVSAITENFDTTPAGSIPSCWSKIIRGASTSYSSIATNVGESHTGANSIKLDNNSAPNTSDVILVLPKVNNLASGTHRLKFYADGNNTNSLIIGTLNNASNNATFTPFQTIATTTSYAEYTVDFGTYQGGDTYIGIKLNSATTYNPVFLDKIRWDATPACADVSGINTSDVSAQTATVNWTAGANETEWQIAYSPIADNAAPEALTPLEVSGISSKELTGLAVNTPYHIWVRSVCGGDYGEWVGPYNFRTACEAVATFNENFDAVTVPALPSCWSSIIRGNAAPFYVSVNSSAGVANSAPNTIVLSPGNYVTADTTNDVILVSPNLSTLSLGTHRVKFFARGNGNLQIGTLDGNSESSLFTSYENVSVTNTMAEYTIDFSAYSGTDAYLGFRINTTSTYTYTYIDDVRWELAPLCMDVTGIALQGTTADSATLSWTAGDSEAAWEIVYGNPATIDPSTLEPVLASDETTKEITGLESNTSYAAWVRSDCGSDKGAWIGPFLFKTACLPAETINENFDAVVTPGLPDCWSALIRGTASPNAALIRSSTSYPHSQTKSIELYNQNPTEQTDVILVSPQLSNLEDGTHRLRFYSSYYYPSEIQVGTLDNNTANAVFSHIQTISINSTYTEYVIDFTNWSTSDRYIGIRLSATNTNSYAFIDDVIWEANPTCPDVENIDVIGITTSDAYVYWEMGEIDAEAWEISYATSDVTNPESGTIIEEISVEDYTIDALTTDTEYNVWVRSICGTINGNWIGPVKFRTKCISGNSFNENFDSTPVTSLPTCWSKIIRGDSFAEFFASVLNTTIEPNSAPHCISMFNSTNNSGNDIILVSPPMDNLAAGTHQLSFYLKGNTANIQVGTLDDNTSENAIFTELTTVVANPAYTKYTIDFSGYTGTNTYIGIRHGGVSNTTIYIDDIVWEPIASETCSAVANVDENFDTTDIDALPECWTAILRGPSENSVDSIGVKATPSASQPNAVNIFKGLSGPQDDQILVLPQLSNLNAGTHRLAFYHAGPPCEIEVGTLSDNTDNAIFTLKETVSVNGDWTQAIVDFTNYTGTDTYIGLRLNSGNSPFLGMFIDNVVWSADLATGEFNNSKFAYYPNPVKNILNLSYEKNITDVKVYNLLGQEVIVKKFDANQAQIDMSGLASGTYILKVTANNTNKTFKIIKE